MLTINEAIARFEQNAEQNERWANAGLNPEANAEYAAEHRQLAEWLRELQERRKEPEIIFCNECKHWKDSDGVYRRGISAESKCPVNSRQVYEGTFFCGMAKRRTDADD